MSGHRNILLKIAAAASGVTVAITVTVAFNLWLKAQGDGEASATAAWALAAVEGRVGQAVSALDQLKSAEVGRCDAAALAAMRDAVARTAPIKQIAVLGPDDAARCTDRGAGGRRLTGRSAGIIGPATHSFEIIAADGEETLLRIRVGLTPDSSLAATLPASLLLPHAAGSRNSSLGYVRIATAEGATVAEAGDRPAEKSGEPRFRSTMQSTIAPLRVTVATPRSGAIASYDDLRRIAIVISGVLAVGILLFALLLTRHRGGDQTAQMARAIEDDEFVPYYQPVVDLQSGRLLGAEVLVRWRRDGELVEPGAFILSLEASGLVLDFTRKLMERVCRELSDAVGSRPHLSVAFNVAPRHFDDGLILSDVGTIFHGSRIRLSQVVLELTERHEVRNLPAVRRTIAALQRIGCKVAIDDVGTGHSGLAYILKLGVDIIKIDKVFVEAIDSGGPSKTIIETLIDLAKNMRMDIVAEGVESFDQVTFLRDRGIGAAQGYVFAPPLPLATFLQLLEAMDPVKPSFEAAKTPARAGA